MPHIQVKMYPGVTEENKKELAIELTELREFSIK
ncbi:tautomerase family protein [Pedobacter sp. BAL39]